MPARAAVLIVEDDDTLRNMYRLALMLTGFEVREATNGIDALRRVDIKPPDVIVLDILLPIVNGIFVGEELAAQTHTRGIPIIVVTGSSVDLGTLKVSCVLRKPVTPEQLVDAVRVCLGTGATQEQGPGA